MDSPEEIEKWIAARRRNFPTQANIQRKKEQAEALEEVGGVDVSRYEILMR